MDKWAEKQEPTQGKKIGTINHQDVEKSEFFSEAHCTHIELCKHNKIAAEVGISR